MIAVLSFGTCATAYASTGYPDDIDLATNIVNSYYKDELTDYVPIALISNEKGAPCLLYLPSAYYSDDEISISRYNGNVVDFKVQPYYMKIFAFDKSNCYSKPTYAHNGTNVWQGLPFGITKDNLNSRILQSYKTILSPSGEVVFQKGTNLSPNPTNPDSPTQGLNILSNLLNKNSPMLSRVLNEIVALLPILLPVLIAFLAIRKGIRFILQTLRSA